MKARLFYLATMLMAVFAITSCSDDCDHTGDVTLTFERIPTQGVDVNMVFYAVDGETTQIMEDQLHNKMSYTTSLNVGNYKVKVYASNVFSKEVGFQISPEKDTIINFDSEFKPTVVYQD